MKIELAVDGMTCPGCEQTIRKVLLSVPGVKSANASRVSKSASVEADAAVKKETLALAIRKAGYKVL
jgi:copper chaperone